MFLLLICILFNTYISVVFKIFERFGIRTLQAIVLNYFVCALTASVVMGEPAVQTDVIAKPWFLAAVFIGLTFILTFIVFAHTVQKFGVVFASIFQKMSLLAPTLLAILFYNEPAGWIKILGIVLAIASILVISFKKADKSKTSVSPNPWLWVFPFGTFLGSCFVDGGLFLVNETGLASSLDIDFIATLFFFAGVFGLFFVLYDYFAMGTTYRKKEWLAGFALGIPNFFSIYFLLMVLSQGIDGSVVFPVNNVGILLCTALLGLLFFNEKFNLRKLIGFAMAIASILLVAYGSA